MNERTNWEGFEGHQRPNQNHLRFHRDACQDAFSREVFAYPPVFASREWHRNGQHGESLLLPLMIASMEGLYMRYQPPRYGHERPFDTAQSYQMARLFSNILRTLALTQYQDSSHSSYGKPMQRTPSNYYHARDSQPPSRVGASHPSQTCRDLPRPDRVPMASQQEVLKSEHCAPAKEGFPAPRADVKLDAGSEFFAEKLHVARGTDPRNRGLLGTARQVAIAREFANGNVPDFMREENFRMITLKDKQGNELQVKVMSRPAGIGNNNDYVTAPINMECALAACKAFDMGMPTKKLAEAMYHNADVRLPAKGWVGNANDSNYMDGNGFYLRADDAIKKQLNGVAKNALVAGPWKYFTLSKYADPESFPKMSKRLFQFGFFDSSGNPIQQGIFNDGHSDGTENLKHGREHQDYSLVWQGVSQNVVLNGQPARYDDVLKDARYAHLLTDEGHFDPEPIYRNTNQALVKIMNARSATKQDTASASKVNLSSTKAKESRVMTKHDDVSEVRGGAVRPGGGDVSSALHADAFDPKKAADRPVTVIPPSAWNDLALDSATRAKATLDAHGNYLLPDLGLASPSADNTPRRRATTFNNTFQSDNHGDVVVNDNEFYVPPIIESTKVPVIAGAETDRMQQAAAGNDLGGLPEWNQAKLSKVVSGAVEVVKKRIEGTEGSYTETWQSDGSLKRVSNDKAADGKPSYVEQFYYDDQRNLTRMTSQLSTGYRQSYSYKTIKHADGTTSSERESAEILFPNSSKPVKHVYSRNAEQVEDKIIPN